MAPGPPEEVWRPPKRLRQLDAIGGRGLLLGCTKAGAPPAVEHCVTLAARRAGESGPWRLVYCSEPAGAANPEWRPLAWSDDQLVAEDPLLDGAGEDVEVLLALHAVDAPPAQHGGLEEAQRQRQQFTAGTQLSEAQVESDALCAPQPCAWQPWVPAAASRPAFHLPASHGQPGALGGTGKAVAGVEGVLGDVDSAQTPEQLAGQADGPRTSSCASSNGTASKPVDLEQQGLASWEQGSTTDPALQPDGQQGQEQQQNGLHGGEALLFPSNGISSGAAAPVCAAATGHGCSPGDWLAAVGAALEAAACCPGRVVAAWRLASLEDLFPAGADLAAMRQPLKPNTLVLHFPDGCFLCPPPSPAWQEQARTPAGTLRRAVHGQPGAAGEEAAAPAGVPARRGFASLLVSKLMRSTPNLPDAAAGSLQSTAGAELAAEEGLSDADSESGSDLTATTLSRLTTTTAASEVSAAPAGSAAAVGAAGASAVAGRAGPAPGGSSRAVRTLSPASVYQSITSLVALQGRVRDLLGRSQAVQAELEARLGPERQRQQQQAALAALAAEAARCRRQVEAAREELADVQAATAAAAKQATVRAQALVTTLKVMQAADRRVSEAEAALGGEAGRGALVAVLRELVARRCQMVCQLGAVFQLGPTPVSIPEAPPGGFLEDRLEQQWAGAPGSSGPSPSAYASSLSPFGASRPPGGGMPGFGGSSSGGAIDSPSKYRQEMRLSIGGLEIRPWVWRKAFEEGGGHDSDAGEDRATAVALGYVAQVVDRLGAYLGVPLRYPLTLRGSKSAVVDCQPPAGSWADGDSDGGLGGSSGGGGPVEYPLYCDSNRDRARFAVGVFLLNKDMIQLLQAHGISAAGPNHLLHNLYKLLLAAQSALPHLPPPLGALSL